jgi:hypothetical protein
LQREKDSIQQTYIARLQQQTDVHERKVIKMQADHHLKVNTDEDKYRQLMKDKDQQRKDFEIDIKNMIV